MLKKLGLVLTIVFLIFSLAGCSGGKDTASTDGDKSGGDKELVVVDWGGDNTVARKKAIIDPFEKKYGVKVTIVTPTDYGKLKAMVNSGNVEWDVVNVDSDFVIRAGKEGLLEKLDYNIVKTEGVKKDLIHEYGIGSELYSTVISYNTRKFPDGTHPKTWSEFWDTSKFPGPRALWKYPLGTLEAALLADGVKSENLYPLDVDRAFKSLDKIKKDIKVWWNAGAQPPQLLANGEVGLAAAWNGRILNAKSQGSPEDVEYNQGLVMSASWVVPKGAPHKELAMKFIDFATAAEQHVAFSENIDYGSTNAKAVDLMSNELKERLGQSPEKAKKQIFIDLNWWVENFDSVNERFEQWLLE